MPDVTLRDGTRIAYDVDDFTDPWTVPETVMLVHGFSKHRRFWYAWVPALARRFRVIRPDLRGHGESSLPPRDLALSLEAFAADLNELADRLAVDRAHWVLAEFATAVGIEFAAAYPDRLKTLTLVGPTVAPGRSGVDFAEWVRLIESEGSAGWARATNHFRLPADADPGLRAWYVEQQGRMPDWLMAAVMRFVPTVDLTDRLAQIRAPTLVVAGSEGRVESIDGVRRAVARIPNAELAVIEGAPLNVMNARPEESLAATLNFLSRHSGAGT